MGSPLTGELSKDPKGENLPDGWLAQPFCDVSEGTDFLNEERCMILLGSASETDSGCLALKEVAEEYCKKAAGEIADMEMRFFSGNPGRVTGVLRQMCGVPDGKKLILLDIPDDGGYYLCDTKSEDLDVGAVKQFIADVQSKKQRESNCRKIETVLVCWSTSS